MTSPIVTIADGLVTLLNANIADLGAQRVRNPIPERSSMANGDKLVYVVAGTRTTRPLNRFSNQADMLVQVGIYGALADADDNAEIDALDNLVGSIVDLWFPLNNTKGVLRETRVGGLALVTEITEEPAEPEALDQSLYFSLLTFAFSTQA